MSTQINSDIMTFINSYLIGYNSIGTWQCEINRKYPYIILVMPKAYFVRRINITHVKLYCTRTGRTQKCNIQTRLHRGKPVFFVIILIGIIICGIFSTIPLILSSQGIYSSHFHIRMRIGTLTRQDASHYIFWYFEI